MKRDSNRLGDGLVMKWTEIMLFRYSVPIWTWMDLQGSERWKFCLLLPVLVAGLLAGGNLTAPSPDRCVDVWNFYDNGCPPWTGPQCDGCSGIGGRGTSL